VRQKFSTAGTFIAGLLLAGCIQMIQPSRSPNFSARQEAEPLGLNPAAFVQPIQTVDLWPTWSHDGRWIAYWRHWPSTDGPPGIYVVPFSGGRPRLVAANVNGREMRFSHDDTKLVCLSGDLRVVDVATGTVTTPFFTDNGADSPSWSVDDTRIAYTRTLRFYDEPLDSMGTHIFSFLTGQDEALRVGGEVVNGGWPQWSPDGSLFAYVGNHPSGKTAIYVLTPDSVQHVVAVATGWWFERFQWVQPTPRENRLYILERTFDNKYPWRVVSTEGKPLGDSPMELGYGGATSPNGRWGVSIRGQPSDSLGVLFLENSQGKIVRQLTAYEPAPVVSHRLTDGALRRGKGTTGWTGPRTPLRTGPVSLIR